jgi:pimeloyl-ACP methyl ester carboxylesterase
MDTDMLGALTRPELLQNLTRRLQRHDLPCDGGHVTWRILGEGPPLVLLHGGHGSWAHWARNLDSLSQRFRVCVADLPGYGDSSAPASPTFASLLDATRSTLDTLVGAQAPIALAGFSFGGLVAARLAVRRGAVSALALLGPAGHDGPRRPQGDLRSWRDAQATNDPETLRQVMRHNLQLHMLASPADEQGLAIHTQACLRTRFHSKSISRAGGLVDSLQALTCPVLLLWGEHDVTATPRELAPVLAVQCFHAQAHVLEGAGHWVQYEAAEQVNDLLASWFTAQGSGSIL